MARALGLPDQPGRSTMDTLTRFVADHQMLIVLDNCEHLLDASAALVNALLAAAAGLTLLTTSREPIGVAGEVSWRVPSLSLADEAIELFTDRAAALGPISLSATTTPRRWAKFARAWTGCRWRSSWPRRGCAPCRWCEILDSLHDRFRLLTGGARTAVRRQQTLRASVDWSHALLTEPERVLFRRLAAFMGGFDLDAAQTVAGGGDVERYQVLDQLTLLVDKSLVVADDSRGRTRYRLLETVRQYALEKLGESGEADAVRSRHRDYYTSLAAAVDAPAGSDYEHRLDQAETEIDNLRAAFAWSSRKLRTRARVDAGVVAAAALASAGTRPGRAGLVRHRPHRRVARTPGVAAAVRARALADKAVLDTWVGRHADSVDRPQQAWRSRATSMSRSCWPGH